MNNPHLTLYNGQSVYTVNAAGDYADYLATKLETNLGQKVPVSSMNVFLPADAAAEVGVQFQPGANGVRYAVIDEAQFRTLMELEARRHAGRRPGCPSSHSGKRPSSAPTPCWPTA